jgi:molybdate transport system substrate-binding protein
MDKKVRVVDVFPEDTHLPIVYPLALTAAAKAESIEFVDYVRGPVGNATFKKYGFLPLR